MTACSLAEQLDGIEERLALFRWSNHSNEWASGSLADELLNEDVPWLLDQLRARKRKRRVPLSGEEEIAALVALLRPKASPEMHEALNRVEAVFKLVHYGQEVTL